MAIYSDIEADKSRCPRCANLLLGNIADIKSREVLTDYGDEPYVTIIKDVTCTCGHTNHVHYIGEPLGIWFDRSAGWLATLPSLASGESVV